MLVRLLNAALMIALPLAVGVVLARRLRPGWRPFLIGAATFLGSQILHIPFNVWVLSPLLDRLGIVRPWQGTHLLLAALALGLSAGVFEECSRYIVLQRWLRDAQTWNQAVMFGAGHGGLEAVALGVVALVALFQATAFQSADLSMLVAPERLGITQGQITAYWAAPASLVMLGSIERAIALCVQISLAVVVLQAAIRRNAGWLGLAVAWHAAVDASAVAVVGAWGPYWTEAMLAVMALISLLVLFRLRRPTPIDVARAARASRHTVPVRPPRPPRAEAIDDSRFTE